MPRFLQLLKANPLPLLILGICLQQCSMNLPIVDPFTARGQEINHHERDYSIQLVEKLGGEVGIDSEAPGEPVWRVDFRNAKISDDTLGLLKAFPKLEVLYLEDTNITNEGLIHVARCTGLTELHLAGNDITDDGLRHLAQLSKLKELNLADTKVTDKGLSHLRSLKQLKPPIVFGTAITAKGIEQWEIEQSNQPANNVPTTSEPIVNAGAESSRASWYFKTGSEMFLETRGDPDRVLNAVRLLERAVELAPENTTFRWNLADAYVHLGNDATTAFATDIYEDLLEDFPNNPRLLSRLSEAYFRLGNNAKALSFAQHRVKITPEKQIYPAALQLTLIALEAREHSKAIEQLEYTCRQFPRRLELRLLMATLQYDAGDNIAARKNAESVIRTLPSNHPLAIEATKMIERSEP